MAMTHISFNSELHLGRKLRQALTQIEEGARDLALLIEALSHLIDGNGSDVAHFDAVTAAFGFTTNAMAKAAYEELASLNGKLTVDSEVTLVKAALAQAFAKFR